MVIKTTPKRSAERVRVNLPARLTWKDAAGAMRFVSVTTRDISEAGVFVEADAATAIPLYRLVHVQLEKDARVTQGIPERLRQGRVLSAVWRVAACRRATGTPEGYALRFLLDPHEQAAASRVTHMPVAS